MDGQPETSGGAGRLWAGGFATAVVAALLAVVGILIARGLLGVAVLAPEGEGAWGNANTVAYALGAALAALLATGLLALLIVSTPRSRQFFTWIGLLLTAIAVILPLGIGGFVGPGLATALINLVLGVSIVLMLNGVARSAYRAYPNRAYPDRVYPDRTREF
ncbi:DUF6069 family protein [Actinosynnema sp. NPDC047251]|uniref:Putative membrane protein n=1 Tax=Saccharothrix espanaensis (strain ATCC 51144 / DSM 44229 / JCM 9112 / NBRC 15066 / NRRL 15764) TaxID=1179773 RepID=K0JZT3_SACES|nr:DUF6069 family protein [Saccharothrix espanaensis]CCH30154.1 putative membrane protein [Saccharothrix espanaensis DSM 44229]